jgi:hypothetical protein
VSHCAWLPCVFKNCIGQAQWLKPAILAIQEAQIRRIVVQAQPRQKVLEIPSQPIKIKNWVW